MHESYVFRHQEEQLRGLLRNLDFSGAHATTWLGICMLVWLINNLAVSGWRKDLTV
jgi:hypothetical protein